MTQQNENTRSGQERLLWLVLAVIALSVPLWYEIAAQPGTYEFTWRWTDQQILVESIVSVAHLVIVIAGVFMLRRAVGDMPQWPMVRIGAWIWVALVALFAAFSVLMFNIGENEVIESYEDEGYRINFVRMGGSAEEQTQIYSVLSCNHTLLYKKILHMDRLVGTDSVTLEIDDDNILSARYAYDGRELREQHYDIDALYQQCREGETE